MRGTLEGQIIKIQRIAKNRGQITHYSAPSEG